MASALEGTPDSAKCLKKGDPCPAIRPGFYRIYGNRFCPYTKRVLLVISAKRFSNVEVVNISPKSKPIWFLEKNPLGQIPVLEVDDTILDGSVAITEYLDKRHPMPTLIPSNWDEEKALIDDFDKTIPPCCHKFYTEPMETLQKTWNELLQHLGNLDRELATRQTYYFGGKEFPSLVDLLLWPWFEIVPVLPKIFGSVFNTIDLPHLSQWMRTMERQPFVYHNFLDPNILLQFIQEFRKGSYQFDLGLSEAPPVPTLPAKLVLHSEEYTFVS